MIFREKHKYRNILLFGVAGLLGYAADLGTTILLNSLLGAYISRIPAFLVAATVTWVFNRNLTFKYQKSQKNLIAEWAHYLSLMTLGLLINYIVYISMIAVLPQGYVFVAIAVAVGSLIGMVINFFNSNKFLYKK